MEFATRLYRFLLRYSAFSLLLLVYAVFIFGKSLGKDPSTSSLTEIAASVKS